MSLDALANELLDALERGVPEPVEAAIDEVLDWLDSAEKRGGLVTFYY